MINVEAHAAHCRMASAIITIVKCVLVGGLPTDSSTVEGDCVRYEYD